MIAVLATGCGQTRTSVQNPAAQSCAVVACASASSPDATVSEATAAYTTLAAIPPTTPEFIRYDISHGLSYSYGFSIADYDRDGHLDISYFDSFSRYRLAQRMNQGAIGYMYWNSGQKDIIVPNETFAFTQILPAPTPGKAPDRLLERQIPLDVNGDGWPDVVGVSNSHAAVVAYLNPRVHNAIWTSRVLTSLVPGAVNLTSADVNGDGLPDVFVVFRGQPTTTNAPVSKTGVAWIENTGLPTGEWIYHEIETGSNFGDPRTLQAGDIEGTGKVDLLVSDAVTGKLAWYSQPTPGKWVRHDIPGVDVTNAHFGRLIDFDGDGHPDILIPVAHGVAWLRNVDGGTTWERHDIVQFTDDPWVNIVTEVVAGDIDGDGKLDVVFSVGSLSSDPAGTHSGGVYWAGRDPNNVWQVHKIYYAEDNIVAVQVVDFNGDGALDVVSDAEYQQNSVSLWLNQLNQ